MGKKAWPVVKKHLTILCSVSLLLLVAGCAPKSVGVQKIIFETDMGNDIDDALALDMLYKYMDTGRIDLLAVMTNKSGDYPAMYVDLMNTWYGYPDIPIGIVRNGVPNEDKFNYAGTVAVMTDDDNKPTFARSIEDVAALPDAHILYRRILADQSDGSVTIISVGFATNLARLLDTPADEFSPLTGIELVARKVKSLCTMAGCFDGTNPHEFSIAKDISSAQKIFAEWPTPIVTSPFEVGIAIDYPVSSIDSDLGWAPFHPVVEACKNYLPMPYDRPAWDLAPVLYTVEGDSSWFGISPTGTITITDDGGSVFTPSGTGRHRYLTVDAARAKSIGDHVAKLVGAKPGNFK